MSRYEFARSAVWVFAAVVAYLVMSAFEAIGHGPGPHHFNWTWWHPAIAAFVACGTGIVWCINTIDNGPPKVAPKVASELTDEERDILAQLRNRRR